MISFVVFIIHLDQGFLVFCKLELYFGLEFQLSWTKKLICSLLKLLYSISKLWSGYC